MFDSLIKSSFQSHLKYEFWPAIQENSKNILIVLHGRGDSPAGFHFLPEALNVDSLNYLFVEAPDPYGPGYSWYDLPPHQAKGIIRSRNLLFELIDKLQSEFKMSSLNIFLLGFSQGCLMSLDIALRYPKHLGGVVGISGYVFFEEEYPEAFSKVAKEQRIWVSHGRFDDVLPFEKTKASIEKLCAQGISIDWTPFDKAHTIDEKDELTHIGIFLLHQLEAN